MNLAFIRTGSRSSALGIDLGRHTLKAVLLQARGAGHLVLTHFATRRLFEEPKTVEALAANLKALLCDLGARPKACGLAISSSDCLVRITDQPLMSKALLREALRLNGVMLLSQHCKDLVLDCDLIQSKSTAAEKATVDAVARPVRYLVGGLPRTKVEFISEACIKTKIPQTALQLAPVALLNGFEYANDEAFGGDGFMLVDIGHVSTTLLLGVKRELVLFRSVEFGGFRFEEDLTSDGAGGFDEIVDLLAREDPPALKKARISLSELVRSIGASISFFEAHWGGQIRRVFVSGGMAKSPAVLEILGEGLQLPCERWDPFANVNCEINLTISGRKALQQESPALGVAFGVAAEILKRG